MLRIAVLASTKGTDLEAIYAAIQKKELTGVEISLVCTNLECPAAKKAQSWGLKTSILPSKGFDREKYDKQLSNLLKTQKIDLIVLVGYMRLFSPWFVKQYQDKIINIHPSLLPSFPGMDLDVHSAVLEYGCKVSGCTIHFVDEGTDTGAIIAQEAVIIDDDETPQTLKRKVQDKEKVLYPLVIGWFAAGKIKREGRRVSVLP